MELIKYELPTQEACDCMSTHLTVLNRKHAVLGTAIVKETHSEYEKEYYFLLFSGKWTDLLSRYDVEAYLTVKESV